MSWKDRGARTLRMSYLESNVTKSSRNSKLHSRPKKCTGNLQPSTQRSASWQIFPWCKKWCGLFSKFWTREQELESGPKSSAVQSEPTGTKGFTLAAPTAGPPRESRLQPTLELHNGTETLDKVDESDALGETLHLPPKWKLCVKFQATT